MIFDTQHKCTVGLDENSEKDMGLLAECLYKIRDAVDTELTTVLTVHHSGYERGRSRGSTAIEADIDCVFTVESNDAHQIMKLKNRKSKDSAPHADMNLKLESVLDSCVIVDAGIGEFDLELGSDRVAVLNFVTDAEDGVTSPEIQKALNIPQYSASRILNGLAREGRVRKQGKRDRADVWHAGMHASMQEGA